MRPLFEAVFEMTRRQMAAGFPPLVDIECSAQHGDVLVYFRFADHEWDVIGFTPSAPCDLEACQDAFMQAFVRRTVH